jgi:hypothetical protein
MIIDLIMLTKGEKMNASHRFTKDVKFLKEFEAFVTFLRNLWGTLAGISILFPLSNVFIQIIPLDKFDNGGPLVWFSPRLFTTLATLVSLFIILWEFGQRNRFQSSKARHSIQKQAWGSFATGLFAILLYLASYYFLAINAFDVLGWESADSRRLIGEIPLLILYSVFFAFVTRAFVLLGMLEFFRQEKQIK